MRRIVAVANGKGGVGKTSLTAGLAGMIAHAGFRVLTVDADPQGNLRRDLGYKSTDGSELASAVVRGSAVEPVRDVRPNLDCIPGGPALHDLAPTYLSRAMRGETLGGLGAVLSELRPRGRAHEHYDLVLIDTPPGEVVIQDLVLAASNHLIIPTRSDEASLDGLEAVADRVALARVGNPDLALLGVVLFGMRSGSTRLQRTVRDILGEMLGGVAPVFETTIRYVESAAVDMRRRSLLPHELESEQPKEQSAILSRLRNKQKASAAGDLLNRNASGLASDYEALANEVVDAVNAAEARLVKAAR